MDSKRVNTEIKRVVWPVLQAEGFSPIVARNAWKTDKESIAVVNFQSFSAHLAAGLQCTSFSFGINLGVYYRCMGPPPCPITAKGRALPSEWVCQARLHPQKTIKQRAFPRPDIWFVDEDGTNVSEIVGDALQVIRETGLPWIAKFRDPSYALNQYLRPRSSTNPEFVAACGTLGAAKEGQVLAVHLRRRIDAIALWQAVLESAYYKRMPDVLKEASERIEQLRTS